MTVMKRILFLLLLSLPLQISAGQIPESQLKRLDAAIALRSTYQERKEARITKLHDALLEASTLSAKIDISKRLYQEYQAYRNETAINYLQQAIEFAKADNDPTEEALLQSMLAYQLARSGYYGTGLLHIKRVRRQALDEEGKREYFKAYYELSKQLATYSAGNADRKDFQSRATLYYDSLMQVLPHDSPLYYENQVQLLTDSNRMDEAMKVIGQWMKKTVKGSHDYAIICYYIYGIEEKKGNESEALKYLVESAICDVENTTYDEASIIFLSRYLRKEGDLKRAQAYISYAYDMSTIFEGRMKNWAMTDLEEVNRSYQNQLKKDKSKLIFITIALSTLAVIALVLLVLAIRQHRKLNTSMHDVSHKNRLLEEANGSLKDMNERVKEVNKLLSESNKSKEEMIGLVIGICTTYIEKMENNRKLTNKMVRNHEYQKLFDLSNSSDGTDEAYKEFLGIFDKVFLTLFPNFVDEFNALLSPPFRIEPLHAGTLNTPLRIFALIRLGITDSNKIAKFLKLANSTVYNYRTKLRNGALGSRDDFEQRTQQLCMVRLTRTESDTNAASETLGNDKPLEKVITATTS